MLDSLRNAARSWVAKALLLLLVVSFGVWGVSSSMLVGASNTVMTVGDQKISPEEYRLAFQRQISAISRQFGTQITPDQARAFGIENQVFSQLAAGATLDQLSADMKLGLSEDRLAKVIAEDPAFRSVNGQFDRALFTSRLRNAGIGENDYIKERTKTAVRSQVVEAVSEGFKPPLVLVDALKEYRDASRTVDYILLSNANIDPVKAPAETVLASWFDSVKARYRAPEYRSFTYVKLQPADIADASSVTDDEVQAEYEKRKDSYRTHETRTIEQLGFPDKEMAEAAAAQLKEKNATFDQLIKDQEKTLADVTLGDFTRESMPDPSFVEPAFKVATAGGTTPVIDGVFGPVILRVTNIRPETMRSFEEVKDELRQQMAVASASREVLSVHDRFEDARAGGNPLEEVAKSLNLKSMTVTTDASGRDDKESPAVGLPAASQLLAEVFRTDPGADTAPVSLGNDGYVWFEVRNIIAERDRPLTEVHDRALADWTADQQRQALEAKALELKARLDKGETLAELSNDLGIAVETKHGLRRNTEDPIFGREAATAAFSGPAGIVASTLAADSESRILLKVTEVSDQIPDAAESDPQLDRIAQVAGDDMLDQMVNGLKDSYGVSVNRSAVDQISLR